MMKRKRSWKDIVKRGLALVLTLVLMSSLIPDWSPLADLRLVTKAAATPSKYNDGGGKGTEAEPWLISNVTQLTDLANTVNKGAALSGVYFKLTADISGFSTPIGSDGTSTVRSFAGHFDGNGKTVTLSISKTDAYYTGMFGYVKGTVENVTTAGAVTVTGTCIQAGGVCGYLSGGTIQNCHNKAAVTGIRDTGGVCGNCNDSGTVLNCSNAGVVSSNGENVGGVCGYLSGGTIQNCYNTGTVSGGKYVGGVCGYNNYRQIQNCYNTGSVTASANNAPCGGVCGYNFGGGVINCYSAGTVTADGTGAKKGGVCGEYNGGNSEHCYYKSDLPEDTKGTKISDSNMKLDTVPDALVTKLNGYRSGGEYPQGYVLWKIGSDGYPTLDFHIHDGILFYPWTRTDGLPTSGGDYYLTQDMTTRWYPYNATISLDLNGHSIKYSGSDGDSCIHINGAVLNLYDCQNTGTITGGEKAGVSVGSGNTFNMYGGKITGSIGGVNVTGGSFNMYGGSVTGNTGGGVNFTDGAVTLGKTASITGNTGTDGTTASNLKIASGKTIALGAGANAPATTGTKMNVGVTLGSTGGIGVFTTVTATSADYAKCFTPDDAKLYQVKHDAAGNTLKLALLSDWAQLSDALSAEAPTAETTLKDADGANLLTITPASGGDPAKYTLCKDITAASGDATLTVKGKKTLDLNGFVINGAGLVGSVITVPSGANLTITDSGSTAPHYFTSKADGAWTLNTTADDTAKGNAIEISAIAGAESPTLIKVPGGAITGGNAEGGGGVLIIDKGTFNMYGGNIVGNTVSVSGGGVSNKGTFNMSGGTISGNKGKYSGGVVNAANAVFNMSSGMISGNTATVNVGGVYTEGAFTMNGGTISDNTSGNDGGGVYTEGAFTMNGGSITGNTAKNGGGVYFNNGTLILGGTAKITGNTLSDGTTANNLYLYTSKTVTLGTGDSAPKEGMSVGITTQTAPTTSAPAQFANANDTDYSEKFFPDAGRLTQDVTYGKDGNGDKKLYLTVPAITVTKKQNQDNPVYGTATETSLYTVAYPGFSTEPTSPKLEWKHVDTQGKVIWDTTAPTGITASLTSGKISIATTAALNAGDYVFRVTNSVNETINDPDDTEEPYEQIPNPMFKCGTGTLTVERAKTAVKPTVADSRTYNGTEQNGYTGAGTHVTLAGTTSATNAGDDYQFTATPESNYAWSDGSTDAKTYSWSIAKAPLTVKANDKSITYGSAAANDGVEYTGFVNSETNGVLGGTLSYAYGTYTTGSPVGTYNIVPSGLTSDNYEITFTNGTLTVTPSTALTVTATAYENFYDGGDHMIGYTASIDGAAIFLRVKGATDWIPAADFASYTDATSTDIEVKAEKANYADATASAKLTIKPRPVTLVAGSANKVYDGNPLTCTTFTVKEDKTTLGYGFISGEGIDYVAMTEGSTITEFGTVTNVIDTYTPQEGTNLSNYTITKESGVLTITKANGSVTAPTAVTGLVYNGQDQALINAGSSTTGTVKYSVSKNTVTTAPTTDWDVKIPTGKDADTYRVWYKAVGDSNHNDTAAVYMDVTIGKKVAELQWTTPTNLVYSHSAKVPTVAVTNLESGDSCTVSAELTAAKDNIKVGTFTFTASGLSDNNYKLPDDVISPEYTVTKAAQTLLSSKVFTTSYDGSHNPVITLNTGDKREDNSAITYEVSADKSTILDNMTLTAGQTYYVRKGGNDNYEPSNWVAFTVPAQAQYTVRLSSTGGGSMEVKDSGAKVSNNTKVYTGTVLTLSATPANNFGFTAWYANNVKLTGNTYTVTGDVTLKAVFTRTGYDTAEVPTPANFTYDGNEHTGFTVPVGAHYTAAGTLSATNAGAYSVTFTLNEGCLWEDGTAQDKILTWKISKAAQDKPELSPAQVGTGETVTVRSSLDNLMMVSPSGTVTTVTQNTITPDQVGLYEFYYAGDANHYPSNSVLVKVVDPITVKTQQPTDITKDSAVFHGAVTGAEATVNYEYGKAGTNDKTTVGSGSISGLTADTEYSYRAFVTVGGKTYYGETVTFRTAKELKKEPTGKIDVTVELPDEASGTLSVESGNTVIRSVNFATLENKATATFDKLPDGYYNVVLRVEDYVETRMIAVANGQMQAVNFFVPDGSLRTIVEVLNPETPKVAVEGLGSVIEAQNQASDTDVSMEAVARGEQDVEVSLSVEKNNEAEGKDSINYALGSGEKLDTLLDISLLMTVSNYEVTDTERTLTGMEKQDIGKTNQSVLEIVIPYNTNGGTTMYRYHDGVSEKLTKLSARPVGDFADGTYYVDNGYIFLYASGFSTYAIAETEVTHGGHGGSANVISAPTGDAGLALYAALSVSSLLGMGWIGKKKRDEE